MNIKITGSGSYIPEIIVSNLDFSKHHFMNEDGTPFAYSNETVIEKFKGITRWGLKQNPRGSRGPLPRRG